MVNWEVHVGAQFYPRKRSKMETLQMNTQNLSGVDGGKRWVGVEKCTVRDEGE